MNVFEHSNDRAHIRTLTRAVTLQQKLPRFHQQFDLRVALE